jgi:hypothetical protein
MMNTGESFRVIVREGGQSSIPETVLLKPIGRGVLDRPPSV